MLIDTKWHTLSLYIMQKSYKGLRIKYKTKLGRNIK